MHIYFNYSCKLYGFLYFPFYMPKKDDINGKEIKYNFLLVILNVEIQIVFA